MSTDALGTLRDIGVNDLGLSERTLYGVRERHEGSFPEPHMTLPNGQAYYRRGEVAAWYREHIESLPTYNRDGGRGGEDE